MDFQLVTSTLLKDFEIEDIHYAIIGGFALGLWEATRATLDMDFLILLNDLPKVETILGKFGYRRVFKSENVAQYVSDLAPYGQIDVLFAYRKISMGMLERSVSKKISGDLSLKTVIPEDLIGLKLQAMVNDPSRETRELSDIESILAARQRKGAGLDWELLESYFSLFQKDTHLKQLKQKYGTVE